MKCRNSWNWAEYRNLGTFCSLNWEDCNYNELCNCCKQVMNIVNCINAASFSSTYFCNKYFRSQLLNCLVVTSKTKLKQKKKVTENISFLLENGAALKVAALQKAFSWAGLCCCCAWAAAFASWSKYIFDFGLCFQSHPLEHVLSLVYQRPLNFVSVRSCITPLWVITGSDVDDSALPSFVHLSEPPQSAGALLRRQSEAFPLIWVSSAFAAMCRFCKGLEAGCL